VTRPPGWTDADAAEQDVLVDALITAVLDHRQRCSVCSKGGPWCTALREGFEIVQDWNRSRRLRSLAAYLRARETVNELRQQRNGARP
jgi:hypothetical protein